MLPIAVFDSNGLLCQTIAQEVVFALRDSTHKPELFLIPDPSSLLELQKQNTFSYVFFELTAAQLKEELHLAERLLEIHPKTQLLFLSSHPELVFTALRLPFFHFIRKGQLHQDLSVALEKIRRELSYGPTYFLFHAGSSLERVLLTDLLYMESYSHTIHVHCVNSSFTASEPLNQLLEKLRDSGFVLIHKSFLVNLYHVSSIRGNTVRLDNGTELLMSRRRSLEVRQRFENYIRKLEWLGHR